MKVLPIVNVLHPAREHLARSDAARVVTVTAPSAHNPDTEMAAVSAARAAVENLTRTLALELAEEGILVNALSVGLVDTPLQRARHAEAGDIGWDPWLTAEVGRRAIPMGRAGSAEEVATGAVFMLSPRCSCTTGSVLPVTGGL